MNKKTLFITPRQVGKTTKIIYEYMKNPTESIVIVHSNSMKQHIVKMLDAANFKMNRKPENIFSQHANIEQLVWYCEKHKVKKIFIDEYMCFSYKNMVKIIELMHHMSDTEIVAFSTSDKLYDKGLFDRIKYYKKYNHCKSLFFNFNNQKDSDKLYVSMITDPDTMVIPTNFGKKELVCPAKYEHMNDEQFQTDIMGKFLVQRKLKIELTYF